MLPSFIAIDIFGLYETDDDDSLNQELVKAFNAFPGFVTKMKDGKVKLYTFTEMAEDTVVILDLRNGKPQ